MCEFAEEIGCVAGRRTSGRRSCEDGAASGGSVRNAAGSLMRIGKRAMGSRRTATRTPMRPCLLSLAEDQCGRGGRFPRLAIAAMVAAFFLFTARTRHSAVAGTAAEIGSTAAASQPVQTAQQEPARQLAAVAAPRATPQRRRKQRSGADKPSRSRSTHRSSAASREHEFIARRAGGGDFHPCRCHFPSRRGSRGRQFHSRRHDGKRWFGGTDSPAAAAHGI